MAHWLYCLSCQQWSRSATPLTEDKVCKFCGSMLKKTKASGSPAPQASENVSEENVVLVADKAEEIESEVAAEAAAVSESEGPDQLEEEDDPAPENAPTKPEEAEEQPEEDADAEHVAAEDEEVPAEEVEEADDSDVVKVSEVRVITDKSEKKERLAKKRH